MKRLNYIDEQIFMCKAEMYEKFNIVKRIINSVDKLPEDKELREEYICNLGRWSGAVIENIWKRYLYNKIENKASVAEFKKFMSCKELDFKMAREIYDLLNHLRATK